MIFRFGDYSLDANLFELRKNGKVISIEPQVFNVLQHLIQNRDRVVSKDDLINVVWNGRAISDATLSSRVFAARRAVGDTGNAQSKIRTLPTRGFRFIGDVILEKETPGDRKADGSVIDDTTPSGSNPAGSTRMPRLAILPFKNLSADLDDYFSDGLTEDIVTNLSLFRELRVIASRSSFQFRSRDLPLHQVAKELDVGYIVDGSVRRAEGRVRISVQLLDTLTGESLWANQFDRELGDIFAVQDEVTHMIAASLGIKLQDAALNRALRKYPAEFDAYDYLLHARRYTSTLSPEMHATARDYLEKAITLDPNYADAYALLANVYLGEHRFDTNPRTDPIGRALDMAETAIRLDPQNAYGHCWLAIVHFFRGENDKFEAEAQRALSLNPNDPEILADIGHYLAFMGEFERGTELSRRARLLNPLHPGWYYFSTARFLYHKQAYEEMIAEVQRISMPGFYWTHLLNAAALGQLGRPEAKDSLTLIKKLKPDFSAPVELRKWNVAADDFEHIMMGLRKAGLKE